MYLCRSIESVREKQQPSDQLHHIKLLFSQVCSTEFILAAPSSRQFTLRKNAEKNTDSCTAKDSAEVTVGGKKLWGYKGEREASQANSYTGCSDIKTKHSGVRGNQISAPRDHVAMKRE